MRKLRWNGRSMAGECDEPLVSSSNTKPTGKLSIFAGLFVLSEFRVRSREAPPAGPRKGVGVETAIRWVLSPDSAQQRTDGIHYAVGVAANQRAVAFGTKQEFPG